MDFAYKDYLRWKEEVDRGAISRKVLRVFENHLKAVSCPRILDFGTGTGSMIRTLVDLGLFSSAEIVGIDKDRTLLLAARRHFAQWAKKSRLKMRATQKHESEILSFSLVSGRGQIRVRLFNRDLYAIAELDEAIKVRESFDAVTGLSLLDLLHSNNGIAALKYPLCKNGLLYLLTIYDGMTVFEPTADRPFEELVQKAYNATMNDERLGSHAGRKAFQLLAKNGFCTLAYDSSDLVIYPRNGGYEKHEREFVACILKTIYSALKGQELVDESKLDEWYATRARQLEAGGLLYVCHQHDILGRKLA